MRAYDKIIIEDENAKPEVEKTAGNKRVEKKVYRAKDAALYKDEVVLSDAEIASVKEEALKPKRKYKKAEPAPVIPAAEVAAEEPKAEKKEKILYKRIEVSDSKADDTASEQAKKSGSKRPLFFAAKKAVTEETTADEKTEETAPEEAKREEDQPELAEPSEEAAATKPSGKKSNAFSALLASIKKTDKKSEAEEKACEPEAAEPKEESKPCDKEAAALETSEQEAAKTKEESETKEDAAEAKESEQQAREEAPSVASAEKAVAAPVEELEKRGKRVFRARDKKQLETVQGEPETKQEKKDEEKSKDAPSKASEKETENKPSEKKEKKSKTVYVAEESVKPDVKVKTKKAAKWLVASVIILALLFITAISAYGFYQNSLPPEIESVSLATESDEPQLEGLSTNGEFSENDTVKISVAVKDNFFKTGESWFIATNGKELPSANDDGWVLAVDGKAELELGVGNHYIFVKDERGNISGLGEDVPEFNRVIAIRINSVVDITYLPIMGTRVFTADIVSIGDADESVTWSIDDTSVALCDEGGQVIGVSNGVTEMVATAASGVSTAVDIMVTDLITIPDTNTYGKPMLGADQFTDEEAALLDKILFSRVEEAGGYGTRAGVVAAGRFLALEFPYRVPYFFENGRLTLPWEGRPFADGEGRYYHLGLYLSEDKFDDLNPDAIRWGPATWGENLRNWETKYAFVSGNLYPNGFDCSGFVSWVLLNGGFDFGDRGAGDFEGVVDMCDYGEQIRITDDLLKSDILKAGDLIYTEGHMAIIIGISEEKIYVAESLITSVRCVSFDRNIWDMPYYLYSHVSLMDEWYENEQGNYTDMWEIPEDYEEVERYWNYPW